MTFCLVFKITTRYIYCWLSCYKAKWIAIVTFSVLDGLDDKLSESEFTRTLMHTKLEKVVGIDNLRKEILRNFNTM